MLEIKGFIETSFVDWPGKLCAVLFLPYCNFRCPYCHNHSLALHPDQYSSIPLEDVFARLHDLKDWVDGICLTGGEPTLQSDLPTLIREIRGNGFLVKLDTNGSNPQMLDHLIETQSIDFVSMDVKAPLNPFSYRRATGTSVDLRLILRSIEILKKGRVAHQFRLTVVPALHSEEDIKKVADQLKAGERLILQNFNPENPMNHSLKKTIPYDSALLKSLEREIQEMR